MKRTAFLWLLLFCTLFCACGQEKAELTNETIPEDPAVSPTAFPTESPTETPMPEKTAVNIFVYMIGSDLESRDAQASADLTEMLAGLEHAAEDIELYVYGGGCEQWHNEFFSTSANRCVRFTAEGSTALFEDSAVPMTESDTLCAFLRRAAEGNETERNILLFWDHGGGALGGFGMDALFPDAAAMDMAKLGKAVADSGLHFDAIGFDACLMGTVETALALCGCADVLIASECVVPHVGWDYDRWIAALGSDLRLSAEELGELICESYIADCERSCPGQGVCLSVTDLNCIARELPDALAKLGQALHEEILQGGYGSIARARMNTVELGGMTRADAVDCLRFCENLDSEKADAVCRVLEKAVLCCRSASVSPLGGLSIYVPFHSLMYTDRYLALCSALGVEDYGGFIRTFNTVEVCGQIAQVGSMDYMASLYASHAVQEQLLSPPELKSRLLAVRNGEASLLELELADKDLGFLRSALSDGALLDAAVEFVCANSFRPSLLQGREIPDAAELRRALAPQKSVVAQVYEEVMLDLDDYLVDYGWIPPVEDENSLWSGRRSWYAINRKLCLVYTLGSYTLEGETYISALIPCTFNGVEGYLTAALRQEGECQITGFMVGYKKDNFGLWGKVISSRRFQPEDSIVLWAALYDTNGTLMLEGEFSEPMRWGDGLLLERRPLAENMPYQVFYRVCDIYDRYYILERSKQ